VKLPGGAKKSVMFVGQMDGGGPGHRVKSDAASAEKQDVASANAGSRVCSCGDNGNYRRGLFWRQWVIQPLRMRTLRCLETSGSDYPMIPIRTDFSATPLRKPQNSRNNFLPLLERSIPTTHCQPAPAKAHYRILLHCCTYPSCLH